MDLRDIEQGLEKLQRLPTVQANMEIVAGESDILLHWQQAKIWRLGASLDDSGSKGTGRYQGGLTFSLDNPLSLSDLFYISGSARCNPVMSRAAKTSPPTIRYRSVTRCCQSPPTTTTITRPWPG